MAKEKKKTKSKDMKKKKRTQENVVNTKDRPKKSHMDNRSS